jgi:hypothetical protein
MMNTMAVLRTYARENTLAVTNGHENEPNAKWDRTQRDPEADRCKASH